MAEVIVSSLVNDLLGRLTSKAIEEFGLLRSFKDDLLALEGYFKGIQDVLQDAEFEKKRRTDQIAFESWLQDLRSESLKMENVLDEVSTEAMLRKLHKQLGIKYEVRAFFSFNRLTFRFRIAHEVKAIRKKIADIAAERSQLVFTLGALTTVDNEATSEMPNRETSSLILSSIVYGRNEEMDMIIKKICNTDISKNDVEDIQVFAIWGMGGLGKTTLAQLVYNHERVDEYFQLKCWIYVSETFEVKELIRKIIKSLFKSDCTLTELDDIQSDLQDKLRGKRFLIVLDDVWIEENTKWEQLNSTLRCGAEGSTVLLTTRSKTTSRMTAKYPELQHELGCLSEEDSWLLFEKIAFAEGREGGERRELEHIGKEIVKKCKGLPLAVKTLGGLMWSKSKRSQWEFVKSSSLWELQENDILPALKLSYDNLTPHLKRCFAYCGLFPKGKSMQKTLLIDLWMSYGLIPTRGEAKWYVLGEDIIDCLLWKSFFQVDYSYGLDRYYKMHDLMHDLARYVMRYDCLVIEPDKKLTIPHEVLHLSTSGPNLSSSTEDVKKLTSLRSIFIFSDEYDGSISLDEYDGSISLIFEQMYLRVLYLVGIQRSTLPESICKLKHLRYLNLSKSNIEVLPESIVYLQNLHVLVLDYCWKLRELPKGMRYMKNLRHLHNIKCLSLRNLPVGIKELDGLQTISEFMVSKKNGAQIGELRGLNLLGGALKLSQLQKVGGLEAAKSANMKNKKEISSLTLSWYEVRGVKLDTRAHKEVLEGLEPNESLEMLSIRWFPGSSISPSWMVNLRNLVGIYFHVCPECRYIPPLGKLPCLKSIEFIQMEYLECFHNDDNTASKDIILFPSLEALSILRCSKFVSWPNSIGNLKKLIVRSCDNLRSLPDEIQSFRHLKELTVYNCDSLCRMYNKDTGIYWPTISHIPNVSIR